MSYRLIVDSDLIRLCGRDHEVANLIAWFQFRCNDTRIAEQYEKDGKKWLRTTIPIITEDLQFRSERVTRTVLGRAEALGAVESAQHGVNGVWDRVKSYCVADGFAWSYNTPRPASVNSDTCTDIFDGCSDISDGCTKVNSVASSSIRKNTKEETTVERLDVEEVCEHLSRRVKANATRKTAGKITDGWRTEARRLIDLDQVDVGTIHAVIDWCQDDKFWKSNIMSMAKFREKFDQLAAKAKAEGKLVDSRSQCGSLIESEDWAGLEALLGGKVTVPWDGNPLWCGDVSLLEESRLKAEWWRDWWDSEGSKRVG